MNILYVSYLQKIGMKEDAHLMIQDLKQIDPEFSHDSMMLIEMLANGSNIQNYKNYYVFSKAFRSGSFMDKSWYYLREKYLFRPYIQLLTGKFLKAVRNFEKVHQKRFDLVHANFGMGGTRGVYLKENLHIPLLVSFFGVDASALLEDRIWVSKYRKMFDAGDRFIVLSEVVKKRIENFGVPSEKINVWNCMVDLEALNFVPVKTVHGETFRIITGARFVEKKGHDLIVAAAEILLSKGLDLEFTFIGYGDSEAIESMIASKGIQDHVKIVKTESIKDFNTFYSSQLEGKHLFLLPSISSSTGDDEGGPALSMVAAQSKGLPVLSTRFPGSEISVIEGRTGFFVEEDPRDIAQKIEFIYNNPEMLEKMGMEGSRLVQGEFSRTSQFSRLLDIYRGMLQEKNDGK